MRRLRDRGSLRVSDFAAELGVSPITMRRDVESLAERRIVDRVHGGATLPEQAASIKCSPAAAAPTEGARVLDVIVPAADYYPEVIKGAREAAAARGIPAGSRHLRLPVAKEQDQARQMLADGFGEHLAGRTGPSPHSLGGAR